MAKSTMQKYQRRTVGVYLVVKFDIVDRRHAANRLVTLDWCVAWLASGDTKYRNQRCKYHEGLGADNRFFSVHPVNPPLTTNVRIGSLAELSNHSSLMSGSERKAHTPLGFECPVSLLADIHDARLSYLESLLTTIVFYDGAGSFDYDESIDTRSTCGCLAVVDVGIDMHTILE